MDGVHIYSLDSLAGYGTPNLLEKKHLNKLILRYTDSNSLSVESLLIIALTIRRCRAQSSYTRDAQLAIIFQLLIDMHTCHIFIIFPWHVDPFQPQSLTLPCIVQNINYLAIFYFNHFGPRIAGPSFSC